MISSQILARFSRQRRGIYKCRPFGRFRHKCRNTNSRLKTEIDRPKGPKIDLYRTSGAKMATKSPIRPFSRFLRNRDRSAQRAENSRFRDLRSRFSGINAGMGQILGWKPRLVGPKGRIQVEIAPLCENGDKVANPTIFSVSKKPR